MSGDGEAPRRTWEGLVSLPAWTPEMATALESAGIAPTRPQELSDTPVAVQISVEAADVEEAMRRVCTALEGHASIGRDAFSDLVDR